MQNCYALGVTHDVTPQVAKIAYEGKLKALAKAGLPEAERLAEERALTQAYVTLSNPAKKDWYDKQWLRHGESEETAAAAHHKRGWLVASVLSVLLVGAVTYYFVHRANEREKLRLEEQRIANERALIEKAAALEQQRIEAAKEAEQARQDLRERQQMARERAYSDSQTRYDHSRTAADQARARQVELSEQRQRQYEDQRQRAQDENERRHAQAEVDRQKRFIAEREREEQRAAAEREARVRYEADRRAREAEPGKIGGRHAQVVRRRAHGRRRPRRGQLPAFPRDDRGRARQDPPGEEAQRELGQVRERRAAHGGDQPPARPAAARAAEAVAPQFTGVTSGLPAKNAARLSITSWPMAVRVACVALPT